MASSPTDGYLERLAAEAQAGRASIQQVAAPSSLRDQVPVTPSPVASADPSMLGVPTAVATASKMLLSQVTPIVGRVGKHVQGNGFDLLAKDVQGHAQKLMGAFPGLRFTSGGRDAARNRAVGGVPNSAHLTRPGGARATDLVGSSREMSAAAAWARANGAKKTLIHNVKTGVHLHVEW